MHIARSRVLSEHAHVTMRIWELAVAPTRFAGERGNKQGVIPRHKDHTRHGGRAARELRWCAEDGGARLWWSRVMVSASGNRPAGQRRETWRGRTHNSSVRTNIAAPATLPRSPHRNEKPPKREALTKNEEENKGGHARTNEERETDVRTKNVEERARTGFRTPSATEEGEEESGVRRNAERTGQPQTSHLSTPYRRGSRVRRRCDEQHGMRRIEAQRRNNTSTKAWTHGPKARRRPVQRRLIIITDRENRRIEGMDVPEKYHLISPFDSPPNNIDTDMGPETWRKRKERNNEGRAPLMPGRPS
ncbi:hypothetical protein C8R44DRAFT_744664 [Mycena epipterygia]|nr:hypothetical protein C8R44DRAFT_744664 [Mycena epipterygia]